MSPDKRNQLILLVIGTLGGIALFYAGVIGPLVDWRDSQRQALASTQAQLQNSRAQVQTATRNLADLEANQQRLRLMERLMPGADLGGDVYLWMLNRMAVLGDRWSILGQDVLQPQPATVDLPPAVPYGAANFSLLGAAPFKHVGGMLAEFENSFPFTRMNGLTLQATTPGLTVGEAEAQMLSFRLDFACLVITNTPAR